MELDHVSGILRSGQAPALLHNLARWHSTDGHGRRGLGAVLSTFYLYQKAQELVKNSRVFPYATFAVAFFCWAVFFLPEQVARFFPSLLNVSGIAVYPPAILMNPTGEWRRLFLAALPHATHMSVFYNLMSFLWRGHAMENRFGHLYVAALLLSLQLVSSLLHVWIAWYTMWEFGLHSFGLSALLMALKVVMNSDPARAEMVSMFGFTFNGRWTPWLELALLYLLFPGLSIVAHVSGLLAGLLFVYLVNPFQVQLEDSHVGRVLKFLQAGLQWLRPKQQQQPSAEEQEQPYQEQPYPDQRQGQQQPPRPRAPQRPTFSLNSHVNPIRVINSRGAVTTLLQSLESDRQLTASEVISVLSLLQRALRQVASNPDEAKFRRINVAKLEAKMGVQAAQAAVVFLQIMGFVPMQGEEEKGREMPGALILFLADLDQSWLLAHSEALTSLDRHIAAVGAAEAQAAMERAAYTHEMAEMFARGYRDRRLNFAALKETAGDVEAAVRKLPQLKYRPGKPPGRKW